MHRLRRKVKEVQQPAVPRAEQPSPRLLGTTSHGQFLKGTAAAGTKSSLQALRSYKDTATDAGEKQACSVKASAGSGIPASSDSEACRPGARQADCRAAGAGLAANDQPDMNWWLEWASWNSHLDDHPWKNDLCPRGYESDEDDEVGSHSSGGRDKQNVDYVHIVYGLGRSREAGRACRGHVRL
mmetsp:Transcript_53543/g.120710  ORF Transcript_53543/g.120710 Transcript_53543/m.120710 type:complete len:184 (-) Transcript_53543:120-671(-)